MVRGRVCELKSIPHGALLQQGPQERAALCIDQMAGTRSLVTGHMDRVVCLWDARECESYFWSRL
jgi:hypothetical protein